MRLLHTSDWHLGHTLHEASREEEHSTFLSWLLDTIVERDVDALLVTGDIFDSANPPASAQRDWYRFLVAAGRRRKGLRVVAIAGNHDSAARLEAPGEVLAALDVTVVGELPRVDGRLDPDRLLVPLSDRDGVRRAWVATVPYLRPSDLAGLAGPEGDEGEALAVDPKATRVAAVYAEAAAAARRMKRDGEAVVLTGHLYAAGTRLSELSERKIQKGNLEAVSHDAFDDDVAYVALGHLHLAQTVGGRENVRYAGSPIPLALSEAGYRHEVVLVELPEEGAVRVETIPVPRSVEIFRLPAEGPGTLAEVLPLLEALPSDPDPERLGPDRRAYLEVRLLLEAGEPTWKGDIEQAVEGKAVRLLRIERSSTGTGEGIHKQTDRTLAEVTPEEVFRMKYTRQHGGDPPEELLAAFSEILAEVEAER
jgi:exonuclease SbcD